MKYKTTVTQILREQIRSESENYENPSYLEIGCDIGYTLLTVEDAFKTCLGIDIDSARIKNAQKLLSDNSTKSTVSFIVGTSKDIPESGYEVVLIDAMHDYESVKEDFLNVLESNTHETFTVIFHDYGLKNFGVRRFVNEFFEEGEYELVGGQTNWNPLGGPTDGPEAAKVVITPTIRERVLK